MIYDEMRAQLEALTQERDALREQLAVVAESRDMAEHRIEVLTLQHEHGLAWKQRAEAAESERDELRAVVEACHEALGEMRDMRSCERSCNGRIAYDACVHELEDALNSKAPATGGSKDGV